MAAEVSQNDVAGAMASAAASGLTNSKSAPVLGQQRERTPPAKTAQLEGGSPVSVIPSQPVQEGVRSRASHHVKGSASAQSLRVKRQAPSFGFGTASREQFGKLFVSQQHTILSHGGIDSPSPTKYTHLPAIGGKQADGRKRDAPVWGFAKADRFLYGYGKAEQRPGPCEYKLSPTIGAKHNTKPDAPNYRFGTSTRVDAQKVFAEHARAADFAKPASYPGPAAYNLPKAVGAKQPDGRKQDPPQWSLGARGRPSAIPGSDGPGAIYPVPRGLGKQPDSTFRSEPAWRMTGRTALPVEAGGASPGPIYELPRALDRQVSGHKPSAPRPSFTKEDRWHQYHQELKRNTVPGPGSYG